MSDRLPKLPTFESAHQLASSPRTANWLVHGIIPRGAIGLLFGDPGAGKSFLTQALSATVGSGLEWLGRPVQRGSVVYLAGEGYGGLGRRMAAWSQHNDTRLDTLPVYFCGYADFFSDDNVEETIWEIEQVPQPVALIVIDTMARVTPGMNEDRANEVGRFVDVCENLRDKFGCTVLALHHSPHSDKSRAKGSIALKAP